MSNCKVLFLDMAMSPHKLSDFSRKSMWITIICILFVIPLTIYAGESGSQVIKYLVYVIASIGMIAMCSYLISFLTDYYDNGD